MAVGLAEAAQLTRNTENVVTLEGTRLSYPSSDGEVEVLRGINLTLGNAEVAAVMGPSGSGKTSLIAVIGGLERPTGGTTKVLGLDMNRSTERERTSLRRRSIGVVFQAYHLVPAMTALQNVALPLVLAGVRNANEQAAALLERVGLGHRLNHRPSALSGGEQQRVAIARAFIAKPRLLLADEPTGNLDQKTGAKVIQIMFDLARNTGASMLLVTHDEEMARRCDRVIAIDQGMVV